MNSRVFFESLRKSLGPLTSEQVAGCNVLLAAQPDMPIMLRAYCMATAWWETAHTMQPIYERGPKTYFDKYEVGTDLGKTLGNTIPGDGYRYRGRGYVQLTGRRNYAKAGGMVEVDLINQPDRALDPHIAAMILYVGMRDGIFTGKKLADYITSPGNVDYVNARRVVNGTDHATDIAEYAVVFERALRAADRAAPDPVIVPAPPLPPDVEPPVSAPPGAQGTGILAAIVRMFQAIFGKG